ncbi:MAG TPA: hypothetical protein PLF84_08305 [Bryobacteraceae bacterium]|nr:hypothetical protein [Bryobacteraceae bacterium]
MADFLNGYGEADAKRERVLKRIVLSLLALAVVGLLGWWISRDFSEKQQIRRFISLIGDKDYQSAYRLWGCDPAAPCRDYSFEKFLEDWGPKGVYTRQKPLKLADKRSCEGGIIQYVVYGDAEEDVVHLYVQRSDLTLGFAPWPVCNPRWQAPATP